MTTAVSQEELGIHIARVLAAVTAGRTFVITQDGHPVAELRPLSEERHTFVPTTKLLALLQGPDP